MLRVLHLVGSAVDDFYAELSRLYAADCLEATAGAGYDFRIAYVSPGGSWRFPSGLSPEAIAAAPAMELPAALERLAALRPDVAVPQMFCLPGMTTYRALLDLLAIPYAGNVPAVMALGADKAKAKAVVSAAGVAVPAGEVLRRGQRPSMPPPVVVKPLDADNSLGLGLVRSPEQYDAALAEAYAHSASVLVEEFVPLGREVRCGVLERAGTLVCLPLEEYDVDPVAKPVRGYADKIDRAGSGDLRLVAKEATKAWIVDPDDPVTAPVWEAARRCHTALGCRDYSLFDFRVDPEGRPWFLEAGLYCSFARTSVVAVMAAAAGIELPDLFERALTGAVERSAGR